MKRVLVSFGLALVGGLLAVLPMRAAVSVCDEASLRAALIAGGQIAFGCDATILLGTELVVSSDVTLDAAGHEVIFCGEGKTRVFQVESHATLFLIGMTLRDGLAQGTNGSLGQPGGLGEGGAIRIGSTGTLKASNCRFLSNRAAGGKGGDGDFSLFRPGGLGGLGTGGAISSQGGGLFLTNCMFSANASAGGVGGFTTNLFGPSYPPGVAESSGGAISILDGSFIAENCSFTTNSALAGGALALGQASGSVSNCVFLRNGAGSLGGAIHHASALTVAYSRFIANYTSGRPAKGGAIFSSGDLAVARSQFTANAIEGNSGFVIGSRSTDAGHADGGALFIASGVANIADSTFDGNTAQGGLGCCPGPPGPAAPGEARGGAVYTQSQTTIQNATFVRNAARGGHFSQGSWPRLAGMGGALACGGCELRILYSTIASNDAFGPTNNPAFLGSVPPSARGGGVFLTDSNSHLIGCILSGNTTNGVTGDNVFPPAVNGGSNLSSDGTGGGADSSLLNVDPKLAPLADNGGPVQTMALLAGSPAIDTALPVGPDACPATDARGLPRSQPNGHCDIGAFEQTFLTIQRVPQNEVDIRYLGVPGESYALQSSSNLVTWRELDTQPNGISSRVSADAVPGQFFRVKLLP